MIENWLVYTTNKLGGAVQGVGKRKMKDINQKSLLRVLLQNDTVSQTEMLKTINLRKATVSVLTNELKKMGMIDEAGEGRVSLKGGRRQQYLKLNRGKIVACGATLRPGGVKLGLCNLQGQLLYSKTVALTRYHIEDWAPIIKEYVLSARKKCRRDHLIYLGAGFITGSTYNSIKKEFLGFSLDPATGQTLTQLFGDAVDVGDDYPNAMALGEMWFGIAAGLKDFLYLQLRNPKVTAVIGGKIYRGHRMMAGEISGSHTGSGTIAGLIGRGAAVFKEPAFTSWIEDLNRYYDPEKIVLSAENIVPGLTENLSALNKGIGGNILLGALGPEDGPRAAAALVFEDHFQSSIV